MSRCITFITLMGHLSYVPVQFCCAAAYVHFSPSHTRGKPRAAQRIAFTGSTWPASRLLESGLEQPSPLVKIPPGDPVRWRLRASYADVRRDQLPRIHDVVGIQRRLYPFHGPE